MELATIQEGGSLQPSGAVDGNHGVNIPQNSPGGGDSDVDNCRTSFDKRLQEQIAAARVNSFMHIQDHAPRGEKLDMFSTACLLLNHTVGTGIFETPKTVWLATRSTSGALFLWCLGSLIAFAGLFVYLELGLTVPRYLVRGEWRSVPRSGGEKNYLEYMFRKPKFLATSTYAVIFIFLGNTAGNGIVFGTKVLQIINYPDTVDIFDHRTGWIIKGIAVATITAACLLHGAWRAGGIWVQNTLAVLKLGILWFFIIAGLATYSGKIHSISNPGIELSSSNSFENIDIFTPDNGAHGWITALLDVTFSYSGFEYANYVLSEVKQPEKLLKRSTISFVTVISISYILINIAYFTVVRPEQLIGNGNPSISSIYLENIFAGDDKAKRALPALVAISAFGNIIGFTFTACRVKQEIAKEGVLPFSRFLRSQYTSPLRMLLRKLGYTPPPGAYEEKTPIPSLLLHWVTSLIMILSPPAGNSYSIFVRLYSYMIGAWFGCFLSGGLLYYGYLKQYLSDRRKKNWGFDDHPRGQWYNWKEVAGFRPWLGPVFPLIYFLICLTIIVGDWLPPPHDDDTSIQWFIVPTIGMGLFVVGTVYWFGLTQVLPLWNHKTLRVSRTPFLDEDENFRYEKVITKWIAGPEDEYEEDPLRKYSICW